MRNPLFGIFPLVFCPGAFHFAAMSEKKKQASGSDKVKSGDKQARLAEALRANLRRRKEQAREQAKDQKSTD